MATLEVHDGRGRVQFVELERDHPVLFGTSAHCEIILEGSGINPVHGRIRFRKGRFKVEASPDAGFVLINGVKMEVGSIEVGDEIVVGSCRLYLLRDHEAGMATGQVSRAAGAEDSRTMVVPPPVPATRNRDDASQSRSRSRGRSRTVRGLENPEWMDDLVVVEGEHEPEEEAENAERARTEPPGLQGRFARALRNWLPEDVAPGQESLISSPLVVSLLLMLVVLIGMGFWLWQVIDATISERTFNGAITSFEEGDYRTAIRDFDAFIKRDPEHERVPKARVIRALANVRQYVSPNGATWTAALSAAHEMFDTFTHGGPALSDAFRDERSELAELVIRIGIGLSDRARITADPKALEEAESTVAFHAEVAGEPAQALLTNSRLPAKLAEARAAVRKAQVHRAALDAMDQALKDESASAVYQARDQLVEQYPDLLNDRELIQRMTTANELIQKAVRVDTTRTPSERGPRPEPLGPPTSVVYRTIATPAKDLAFESLAFALAEGIGYAVDAETGAPVWQVPLGLASPFAPMPVPGESAAIAFDARSSELVRLDGMTGALVWRQAMEERVADPPLVLGNQLVQVLPSGKLLFIALATGELRASMDLGRPLTRTPVTGEAGRHLYVLGRQDILYVLDRDPLACVAVEYLGHPDGSVPCTPALLGRYLIVPRNDSLTDSHWQILLIDSEGAKVKPVQEIPVSGWTWQTPTASGQFVWAIGDRGAFEAFGVGPYSSKSPFQSVARMTPDAHETGPAFALARTERELWSASGHSGRYRLDPEHGSIQVRPLSSPGPARAPIQIVGKVLVATFRDNQYGGAALLGVDPESAQVLWKTVVGASWSTALTPAGESGGLSTLGRDGRSVTITPEQAARGGFVEMPAARPGSFTLPTGLRLRVTRESQSGTQDINVIVPRPFSRSLWVPDPSKHERWREVILPAAVAADPVAWQGGVLVPAADTRVYLIDPITGRSMAEPYVPRFDRDHQGTWLPPALLDSESAILADDAGRVRRVSLETKPVPRLAADAERMLEDIRIIAGPGVTGASVLVPTSDGRIRALASRDLSPIGAWPLDASIAGRPIPMADIGLVVDRAGGIMAFGRDGQRTWSIKLGAEVVGLPRAVGETLLVLTADGVLHVLDRSDGDERDSRPLDVLPAGGPIASGRDVMIPVAPGTLRPLALESIAH